MRNCIGHSLDGLHYDGSTSMLSFYSLTSPTRSERAMQMTRIVSSVDEFSQKLSVLEMAFKKAVEFHPENGGLGPQKTTQLFANVSEVAEANASFLADLLQMREVDPNFNRPVGPMLQQSLAAMMQPYRSYCRELPFRLAEFRRLMTSADGALYVGCCCQRSLTAHSISNATHCTLTLPCLYATTVFGRLWSRQQVECDWTQSL
jgi:hypothetical protein